MTAGSNPLSAGDGVGGVVDTPLQVALCNYLEAEEHELFAEDSPFVKSMGILGVASPMTREDVSAFVRMADKDACAVTLARIARSFKRNALSARDVPPDETKAHQALLRVLLVVSETYVRLIETSAQQEVTQAHHPVWTRQRLLSCILAAARVGCSLSFKQGVAEPWNVVDADPPSAELAVAGEESHGRIYGELLRALDQLDISPLERSSSVSEFNPVGRAYFEGELPFIVEDARAVLGAEPVIRVVADGAYANPKARLARQDYLRPSSIPVFYCPKDDPESAPEWVVNLLGELNRAFSSVFPPPPDEEVWQGVDKALGELQQVIEAKADSEQKTALLKNLHSIRDDLQTASSPGGKLKKVRGALSAIRHSGEALERLDKTLETGEKVAGRVTSIISTIGTFVGGLYLGV